MRKPFNMAILAATFMALTTLPAQALELGSVQVILQPRVVVFPEPRPRVVVVEEDHCPTVVEQRVIVVHKNGSRWDHRDHRRGHGRGRDRWERDWDRDDDYRYERVAHREVVVIHR